MDGIEMICFEIISNGKRQLCRGDRSGDRRKI